MEDVPITDRPTLCRKAAAFYLGVCTNTLDKLKEIPRVRIGAKILYRRESLDKYLRDREKPE